MLWYTEADKEGKNGSRCVFDLCDQNIGIVVNPEHSTSQMGTESPSASLKFSEITLSNTNAINWTTDPI